MNNEALVTIIIPNYNTEQYIAETIQSVIDQTYQNWELLIVDDCSTDKSRKIISDFTQKSSKIKILSTPKNSGGPATPRNIGIENAKGEYIAFLDSDDTWLKDKLKFHINFMQREHCLFSSTFRNTFSKEYEKIDELKESKFLKYYEYADLLKKNLINTSAVIIHKSLADEYRFDVSKDLIAIEDFDYWLKVLKNEKQHILVSTTKTINYRITDSNISKSKYKMAKKFALVIRKHEKSIIKTFYYFINYFFLSLIYQIKKR